MTTDLLRLPTRDAYGNATNSASVTQAKFYGDVQNLNDVARNYQVNLASWSAAENAAYRIRNDPALVPVIYTIGLTNEVDDVALMKRIANVKNGNPGYDSTKPAGRYVNAPTASDLASAFATVASEILRLTNLQAAEDRRGRLSHYGESAGCDPSGTGLLACR